MNVIEESNRVRKQMLLTTRAQVVDMVGGTSAGLDNEGRPIPIPPYSPTIGAAVFTGAGGHVGAAGPVRPESARSSLRGSEMGGGKGLLPGVGAGGKGDDGAGAKGGKAGLASVDADGRQAGWICDSCGNFNYENRKTCNMRICGAPKRKTTATVYWSNAEVQQYKLASSNKGGNKGGWGGQHHGECTSSSVFDFLRIFGRFFGYFLESVGALLNL